MSLEARKPAGDVAAQWRYDGNGWTCIEGREKGSGAGVRGWSDLFEEVIAACIKHGWQLVALAPAEEHAVAP